MARRIAGRAPGALGAGVVLLCLAFSMHAVAAGAEEGNNFTRARKQAARRQRRIIYYDDGCQLARSYDSPETFLESRLNQIIDTQVDAVWYCTGGSGTIMGTLLSKVGENYGDLPANLGGAAAGYRKEVLALKATGHEAIRLAIDFCHQRKMELLFSVRMNDIHDSFSSWEMPRWKREHPEYMMGKPGDMGKYPGNDPRRYWSSLNYEIPEVREKIFRFFEDVCRRYDVDGIHLDFWRHMKFFPPTQEMKPVEPRHVEMMNDLLRRLRRMTEREGKRRGRPLIIAASVTLSVERSLFVGLDMKTWLEEDLVDVLAGDGGYVPKAMASQVVKLTELSHKYNVPFYPCISRKGMIGTVLEHSVAAWRGTAMNIWHAGGDGVFVYDFNPPEDGYEPLADSLQKLREIGSPQILKGLDKIYGIDHSIADQMGGYHRPGWVVPDRLPITLAAGKTATAKLWVGEDIVANAPAGKAAHARLRLQLAGAPRGAVAVKLNGKDIEPVKSASSDWLEFEPDPRLVRAGENLIDMQPSAEAKAKTLVLNRLYLEVRYKHAPIKISLGKGAADTIAITDADGTEGSITVDNAEGSVVLVGGGVQKRVSGRRMTLKGDDLRLISVHIKDSSPSSSLTFRARGGDGRLSVDDITIDGPMKCIHAGPVNLQGDLKSGPVRRMELGNAGGHGVNRSLTIAASADPGEAVSLVLDRVHDLRIDSGMRIKSITATQWLDTDEHPDAIRAPALGRLEITGGPAARGDFNADLILTGRPAGPTLGDVNVAGRIGTSTWNVSGDGGTIAAGSIASGWNAGFLGTLRTVTTKGGAGGYIAAKSIDKVRVGGKADAMFIFAGAHFGADGRYGGGDDTFGPGGIGTVEIVGDSFDVLVCAGLDPRKNEPLDGDDAVFPGSRIGGLKIGGVVEHSYFVAAELPAEVEGLPAPSLGKAPFVVPDYSGMVMVEFYAEDFESVAAPTSIKAEPFKWNVEQPDEDLTVQPIPRSGSMGLAGATSKTGSGSEAGWFEKQIAFPAIGTVIFSADVWVNGDGNSNIGLNVGNNINAQGVLWGPVSNAAWQFDPIVISDGKSPRQLVSVTAGEMANRKVTVKIWVDLDNRETWGSISNGTHTYTTSRVPIARTDLRSVIVLQYGNYMDVDDICVRRARGPGRR